MRSLLLLLLGLGIATMAYAQAKKDTVVPKGATGLGDFISKTSYNILNNTDVKQTFFASYNQVQWAPFSVKPRERKLLTVESASTLYIGINSGTEKRYYPIKPGVLYVLTDSANGATILKTVE
jgi:hypothetical protein